MLAARREGADPFLQKLIRLNTPLHIVCLDAPSPPDYGGAIDMFYKIKALAQTGRKITLHYFDYHPLRNAKGLEDDCVAIHAYRRKSIVQALPLSRPFIVESRINAELIRRLNEDDHPILLEGLHCSGIIPCIKNPQRMVLRMHNDEAAYYHYLAQAEKRFLKRTYFRQESRLLTGYQQELRKDIKLACLSESDKDTFANSYGFTEAHFVPCFIPWQAVRGQPGKGGYCLYHGNMQVAENEEAALWLVQNVFSGIAVPLVIAGKGISGKVEKEAARYKNASTVNNPSITAMDDLIRGAHINVLPSLNHTGVKLKLLHALLNGRFCLTNAAGIEGSGLAQSVHVEEEPADWCERIKSLMANSYAKADEADRSAVLHLYNNPANAEVLSALCSHCQ